MTQCHKRSGVHCPPQPRGVAQLVAHRSPKPGVAGSSPVAPAGYLACLQRSRRVAVAETGDVLPVRATPVEGHRLRDPENAGLGRLRFATKQHTSEVHVALRHRNIRVARARLQRRDPDATLRSGRRQPVHRCPTPSKPWVPAGSAATRGCTARSRVRSSRTAAPASFGSVGACRAPAERVGRVSADGRGIAHQARGADTQAERAVDDLTTRLRAVNVAFRRWLTRHTGRGSPSPTLGRGRSRRS